MEEIQRDSFFRNNLILTIFSSIAFIVFLGMLNMNICDSISKYNVLSYSIFYFCIDFIILLNFRT